MELEAVCVDVAMCTRLLVEAGILGYSGHVSARVGERELVIQPVDDVRAELAPERLLVVDLDGSVTKGEGTPPSEVFIHTEIYRARPDVGSVAHFHHDRTTLFSMVEGMELVPVKNHASRWSGGIPVHRDVSHIDSPAKGAALAATTGGCHAALLRAHGEVVLAESPRAVFVDSLHLVENAEALSQGLLLGQVDRLSDQEIASFLSTFRRERHVEKVWKYYATVAAHAGVLPESWLDA